MKTRDAPKKSLGQNFLINPGVAAKIIALANINAESRVIEIGPGRGALTAGLLATPFARLILIEKDEVLAREIAPALPENARMEIGDALEFDWAGLKEEWLILGNLPYNVASPLVWDILSLCRALKKAVFMTQKEVAERIIARPGTSAYGALSVWTQSFSCPRYEFTVKPGSFFPPPKVDSAVISFIPKKPESLPRYPRELRDLSRLCFQNRRKQLGGVFSRASLDFLIPGLEELGASPRDRAENLTPAQYNALAAILARESSAPLAAR